MYRQCIHTIKTYAKHAHQLLLAMIYVSPHLYILYMYSYVKFWELPSPFTFGVLETRPCLLKHKTRSLLQEQH